MSEGGVQLLHEYELRLLRCSISTPTSDSAPRCRVPDSNESHRCLHFFINDILSSIEAGNYLKALSSDAARKVILSHDLDFSDSFESAERAYTDLLVRVESFVTDDSSDDDEKACRVILVVCVAVAAFFWFTQCNMTGPIEGLARRPLPIKAWWEGTEMLEWGNWARIQLISVGSDLLGKFSFLQHLVFSKMLLFKVRDLLFGTSLLSTFGLRSVSWWLHRFLLIHQRILDERSSSLFDLLQVFSSETLGHFGTLDKVKSYFGAKLQAAEASVIVSVTHLEAAIMDHIYGRVDSCRVHLGSAEVATGLHLSVTGVLGFHTMHQVEPKAQRVLVSNMSSVKIVDCCSENDGILSNGNRVDETSDILMTPKLLEDDSDFGNKSDRIETCGALIGVLTPTQQAVVLAQCLLIEKTSRRDEMQRWDMSPYIEAIDSQQSSYFIIQCFCDILRIRWESTRNRTKERALGMMDKLVEGVHKSYPGAEERLPLCFATYVPSIPALRKEYGLLLVSCGVVGEAIRIFEDLELWDNLIYCYSLLDKKAAAAELIKKRLCEMPDDPKLWCSLGDVTQDENCYDKALEVSHDKSARAKRSLARGAYARGDYEKSKILWESAMALNSLYPDGWFALGAAALKARDIEKALDAFTRAVQVDPENGEAWNNIACLHMIKKKNKESFIAFKEALKFKRGSWQLWENYSHVALDVGNVGQALEALQMVLRITNNKRIDTDFLAKVMLTLEERIAGESGVARDVPVNSVDSNGYTEVTGKAVGMSRETEQLVELFGKILQQVSGI